MNYKCEIIQSSATNTMESPSIMSIMRQGTQSPPSHFHEVWIVYRHLGLITLVIPHLPIYAFLQILIAKGSASYWSTVLGAEFLAPVLGIRPYCNHLFWVQPLQIYSTLELDDFEVSSYVHQKPTQKSLIKCSWQGII